MLADMRGVKCFEEGLKLEKVLAIRREKTPWLGRRDEHVSARGNVGIRNCALQNPCGGPVPEPRGWVGGFVNQAVGLANSGRQKQHLSFAVYLQILRRLKNFVRYRGWILYCKRAGI